MAKAYDKVTWRGVTLNRRTAAALEWAEKDSGVPIQVSQGSYNAGGVAASGSTHDGGGAADVRTSILSETQRKRLLKSLKKAGACAWYRGPGSGFSPHIHLIMWGDKQASNSARWQCSEYDAGRSGLSRGGADNTWRADPPVKFNYKRRKPVPR